MPLPSPLPRVIQGGMGVAVSGWRLANAVARAGQLGVVSGSMLDTVFVRRLQDGDIGGHLRRAVAAFPDPDTADAILRRYYRPAVRSARTTYKTLPMYKQYVSDPRQRVTVLANFVEVWLAKEGHTGRIGLNRLTKVQMPNLASLYGAMLGGVDVIIMGAGIPREIPSVLDAFAEHRPAQIRFDIEGLARDEVEWLTFDPASCVPVAAHRDALTRPSFVAVVSAASLAATLARKANGRVDGFVVQSPAAGGHNAPPRGTLQLNGRGEPVYGERDVVDLAKVRELGLPFWLAGGIGSPDGLGAAVAAGAAGIQVGTLFAYCEESGLASTLKTRVLDAVAGGTASLRTDPRASPTGYPFKIVELPGDADRAARRTRVCDLGYLRVPVRVSDGRTIYRCAAEPVEAFVAKGGNIADTVGRRCLCNGLTANIGQAQWRLATEDEELPLVTSGDDLRSLASFAAANPGYTADQVVLESARALGLSTQINTTISRYNVADLEPLMALMEPLGIALWSVFFIVPTGRARPAHMVSAEEFEAIFHRLYDLSKTAPFDIKTTAAPHYRRVIMQRQRDERRAGTRHDPPMPITGGVGFSVPDGVGRAKGVTGGDGFVFVSHRGEIYPSGFLPVSAGNVRTHDLVEIYRTHELFRALRDRTRLKGKCGACEYRSVCGGSLISISSATCIPTSSGWTTRWAT